MQLSLGPILYYWPRQSIETFYEQLADMPVSVVYLGETVCAKRRSLSAAEWIELARQLAANTDKQIVLSTLALIEAGSELSGVKKLCNNGELLIEANEMGAVHLLSGKKLPFVGGAGLNIYNAHTLTRLAALGLQRWVAPIEISHNALSAILSDAPALGLSEDVETEVFSFGRLPLAYSARCFTARYHNLPKDDCQYKCIDYPQGLPMDSQEGENFLTINGVQTQSGAITHLLPYWQEMEQLGVSLMRISPQPEGTTEIIQHYHQSIKGETKTVSTIEPYLSSPICDGYWCGEAGMIAVREVTA